MKMIFDGEGSSKYSDVLRSEGVLMILGALECLQSFDSQLARVIANQPLPIWEAAKGGGIGRKEQSFL